MGWKSAVFLVVPFWSFTGLAQTIEIDGRTIRLQPRPSQGFWRDSADTVGNRTALPAQIDLANLQTPVKDQGNRGSCAYFTTIALFEHALKIHAQGEQELNLSEEYLIYANKALDRISSRDDGSFLSSNIRSFLRHGLLLEEQMPYTHSWFEPGMPCAEYTDDSRAPTFCRSHFPPSPAAQAAIFPAERYAFQVDSLQSIAQVKARLADGQAVTISVPVNQNGWRAPDGRVEHNQDLEAQCTREPDLCGGHTVLLTGYDDEEEVFFFKNSWGASWGLNGYGKMPYSFVQNWSYGSFFAAQVERFDGELTNQSSPSPLSSVAANVRRGVNAQGEEGVYVSLAFDYTAPLGSFFYVSVFPQIPSASQDPASGSAFESIYAVAEDGTRRVISDRRFAYSRVPGDLQYGTARPFELFIADAELEQAGLDNPAAVVLRPSIYEMSDVASYKILYREYLPIPAL